VKASPRRRHPLAGPALPLLTLLALITLIVALRSGSLTIDLGELFALLLFQEGHSISATVLFDLRLPRAVAAITVGGLLAVAGVVMQTLLRNPLADPYILGVSGGATVAALAAITLGAASPWIEGASATGALAATLLVIAIGRGGGDWSPTRLLLGGVVLAAGWGALTSFLLVLGPEQGLRGMLFWLMGDLGHAPWPWPATLLLLTAVIVLVRYGRDLNLLARGAMEASALGLEIARLRGVLLLAASLLTATAVTIGGPIAFVGLVTPHLLRLLGIRDHRLLIPASALAGGALLTVADTLARTALAPRQLPVGVVTAAIGVPLFLWLLGRNRG
jgi:iron complex transport system permease protein